MKHLKDLKNIYIINITLCFMLLIYEPFVLYAKNINDLTYDLYIIAKPLLIGFIIIFLLLSIISTIIYFCDKKKNIYKTITVLSLLFIISAFIQGFYLSNSLPALDGEKILWNKYLIPSIISTIIWLAIFIIGIIYTKKYGFDKLIKKTSIICIIIFAFMLTSMTIHSIVFKKTFEKKDFAVSTTINQNKISNNHNIIVLVVDAVDSSRFNYLVNKNNYQDIFDDFTYYKDTTGVYYYTRETIPFILSNKWFENKEDFLDYYDNALDNSELLKNLEDNNYDINLYLNETQWRSNKYKRVSNLTKIERKTKTKDFLIEQIRYDLFKYLPFPLKRFTKIEKLDLNKGRLSKEELYSWGDVQAYYNFKNNDLEVVDNNIFKMIHIEGSHVPANLNKDLKVGDYSYEDKIEAAITVIKEFLKQLKESGKYDNTSIIIMSDHGYRPLKGQDSMDPIVMRRQNPILLIKGENEHHDLQVSDKAISFVDLNQTFKDLLEYKTTDDLFTNVNNENRRLLLFRYEKSDHMEEYNFKGKAWEYYKMKKTGKTYDR